jgi:URI fold toxin 2
MNFHGNSNKNTKEHHLYAIHDLEENDVFKYGISDKSIDDEGQSKRMREQVDYLNRAVGWLRYFAEIIMRGIAGKAKARELEDKYIKTYRTKHGRNPRGNLN